MTTHDLRTTTSARSALGGRVLASSRSWIAVGAWLGLGLVGASDVADASPSGGVATPVSAALLGPAPRLSEIVLHDADLDTLEFVEIQGTPNQSLAQHMLVVVDGDSQNAGVVDRVVDLGAYTIPASGYFVLGDTNVFPKDVDLGAFDQLENGTCTIYLVATATPSAITSLVGTRIDLPGATTSLSTLATIVDLVAIADRDFPDVDVTYDGATVLGPDGSFAPAGVYRCANAPMGWSTRFLDYDPLLPPVVPSTPGAANANCDPGVGYCFGDGSGTACPCGNASAVGAGEGCLNSFGVGGKLLATGTASLSGDTVVLQGSQLPDGPALYFQGSVRVNAGAGFVFGDGLRCAGGSVFRLGIKFSSGSVSQYPMPGDLPISLRGFVGGPGTRTYQAWYRNSASFCSPATYNLTGALEIQWVP